MKWCHNDSNESVNFALCAHDELTILCIETDEESIYSLIMLGKRTKMSGIADSNSNKMAYMVINRNFCEKWIRRQDTRVENQEHATTYCIKHRWTN